MSHFTTPSGSTLNDARNRLRHGRLVITAKSKKTGEHITLRLRCKPPKGSKKRNVLIEDAGIVAIDAGRVQRRDKIGKDGEVYEYVGGDHVSWMFADRVSRAINTSDHVMTDIKATPTKFADPARLWTGDQILRWLSTGRLHPMLEINLEDFCAHCGRELTHPESKQRGLGPVCFGKRTKGQHQTREDLIYA